jgi:CRP-like cAMP-binding protein/GNAT superfamily N-acetyltransferase
MPEIAIRTAEERDARAIRDVFVASYGADYPYPEFYDVLELKKLIYSDETLMYVGEMDGRVVGTAAVFLEIGAFSDLVGEFGRLAVEPPARNHGVGSMLMHRRLEEVHHRLHVGISETRAEQPYSMAIGLDHDFVPLGFLPRKFLLAERESLALMVRYFGDGLALRRNHPRIIPEIYPLANLALESCGLTSDAIVDDRARAYPHNLDFESKELTLDGYATLLRIERGRVRNREVFGPVRLHYGFFRIQSRRSTYLLATAGRTVAGAVGFTTDSHEKTVRVFELISVNPDVVRFLVGGLVRRCRDDWGIKYIEIDVSAYAPAMQRTLLEMNFVPVAYLPAMTFHRVERLDVVKMARLLEPFGEMPVDLPPPVRRIAELVARSLTSRTVVPRIERAMQSTGLFADLDSEQARRLASWFEYQAFEEGAELFSEGNPGDDLVLVLEGEVALLIGGAELSEVRVRAGECLGEASLLASRAHSATARAVSRVEAAVIDRNTLAGLARRRPDIGLTIYRNLARELGQKLSRSDLIILGREGR